MEVGGRVTCITSHSPVTRAGSWKRESSAVNGFTTGARMLSWELGGGLWWFGGWVAGWLDVMG